MGNFRGTHTPRLGLLILVGLIASLDVKGDPVNTGGDTGLTIPARPRVVTPETTPASGGSVVVTGGSNARPEVKKCAKGEVTCGDGVCVPERRKCNGVPDCMDAKDEDNWMCGCPDDMHVCGGFYPMCVPLTKVCDGMPDCARETDEDPNNCHKSQVWIKSRKDPDVFNDADDDWRCNCLNTTTCETNCECKAAYFGPFCQHLKTPSAIPKEIFLEISFEYENSDRRVTLPQDPKDPLYKIGNKCLDPLWKFEVMYPPTIYFRLSKPINFDWLDVVWRSDRVKETEGKVTLWLGDKQLDPVTTDFTNVRGKGPKYVYRMTHDINPTFMYSEVRVNVTPMELCDIQLSLGMNMAFRAVPRIKSLPPDNVMPWYRLVDGTRFSENAILVEKNHPFGYTEASVYFRFETVMNAIMLHTKRVQGCGGSRYHVSAYKYREKMVFGRNYSHYSLTGAKTIFAPSPETIHRVTIKIYQCMQLFEVEVYGVKKNKQTFSGVMKEVKDLKPSKFGAAKLAIVFACTVGIACLAIYVIVKLVQRRNSKTENNAKDARNPKEQNYTAPEQNYIAPE